MTKNSPWKVLDPDLETALEAYEFPLEALASGTIPAIVLRSAIAEEACQTLVRRLIDDELLFDPGKPMPERFRNLAIPEGYYREGRNSVPKQAWQSQEETGRIRIDIGSSLGYRGSDKEAFLAHSNETHELFGELFADGVDPVRLMYENLQLLCRDKQVVTAHEPDGRRYGPAIIRAHYGGYTYPPHFDSVRLREKREDYAVHQFDHQFAGVLVLQNTQLGDTTAQCVLHRCLWDEAVDPHLRNGTFHDYAAENQIENTDVILNAGDLYFFNTRSIHEVPGVSGKLPRIVLATFIGFSKDRDEIFVWS